MYDCIFGFVGFDNEIVVEEEVDYMEVDMEKVRSMLEFWEDVIEDVVIDFNDEDLDRGWLVMLFLVEVEDEGWFFF